MSLKSERRGIHVDQSELLCKKGCGYYGNVAWQGFCSKCWREEYHKARQKQIQEDWELAERLQREEEEAFASSQSSQGAQSLTFSKFEEKKTNEKTRKVTTVKKFFSTSSRVGSKKAEIQEAKAPSPSINRQTSIETDRVSKEFLEFLKTFHKTGQEIYKQTKLFLEAMPYKRELSIEEQSEFTQDFYQNVAERMQTRGKVPPERVEKIMDQIEKYIMTRLYKYVFCPETTDDEKKDLAIQKRIRALHWVTPQMLCVPVNEEIPEVSDMVVKAITVTKVSYFLDIDLRAVEMQLGYQVHKNLQNKFTQIHLCGAPKAGPSMSAHNPFFFLKDVQNQKLKTSIWYREVWEDKFLSWNASMFDGIREISLPLSAIWAPDIIINEFLDTERSPDLPYVYVNSSGIIKNSKPIQVVSACSLETYAFPFDIQNCSLTFNSILHTVEDVDLAFLRSREDIEHDRRAYVNDSEWELLSVPSTYSILQSSAGDFAQIQFFVVIRRRPVVYVVSLLIPSLFLMIVDLGSFYLPPNCRARIMFKTSVLVGYTVFRVNMSDEVPRSTVGTPLIGVFFTLCMAFLVLSLCKSIFLVRVLHDEQRGGQERALLCLRGSTGADGTGTDPRAQLAGVTETPICREQHAQPGALKEVWSQLRPISSYLQAQDQADQKDVEWLALLYHFDQLLFRSYLVVLGLYAVTLCSLWGLWSGL